MNGSLCNSRLLITGGHQLSFMNLHRVGDKVTTVDYVLYCSVTKAPVPRGSRGKAPHILNFDARFIGRRVMCFKHRLLYQRKKDHVTHLEQESCWVAILICRRKETSHVHLVAVSVQQQSVLRLIYPRSLTNNIYTIIIEESRFK